MQLETKIEEIISPAIADMGYDLVRIKMIEGTPNTLQIMAERQSDKQLGIDDCTDISRTVSQLLDVEDPISNEYNLEVSSPGLDRPLVKSQDFADYANHQVKISLALAINDRKRFKGELLGIDEANEIKLILNDTGKEVLIPFNSISEAKIVITDELLEQHRKQQSA